MLKASDPGSFLEFLEMVVQETKASSGIIYNSSEDLEGEFLTKNFYLLSDPNFSHRSFPQVYIFQLLPVAYCLTTRPAYLGGSLGTGQQQQQAALVGGDSTRVSAVQGSKWLELLPNGFPRNGR
ncbi:hypothetical protein V6N13_121211 [Hibiscus sabdariffa]|uniref:Uncharacterized protein n=1 Tax=Hibiscus sabdariffa TaxID=183260 RepID=A0ABR2E8I8_9ROSI